MAKFQIGPARLRNGWEARIYALDGGGENTIHGAFRGPDGGPWRTHSWGRGGRDKPFVDGEYDLLPNAGPVVSEAAIDAFYGANGWGAGVRWLPDSEMDRSLRIGLRAAFAVMLAEGPK